MKIEVLPVERWPELERAYRECGSSEVLPLPKVEQSVILAVFEGDRIVGCAGAEKTWVASPFWVDKKYRGNGLASQLIDKLRTHNTEDMAELLVTTNPHVDLLVHQLGFIPVPGTIWRR
jgi:GNAT superfamily N-acetyltransferase